MLFGLEPQVVEQICAVFRRFPEIQTVTIYGSRAMGTYRNGSDLDLTFDGEYLNADIMAQIADQLDDLPMLYSFDLSRRNQISNPQLLDHIQRVGQIFYAQSVAPSCLPPTITQSSHHC